MAYKNVHTFFEDLQQLFEELSNEKKFYLHEPRHGRHFYEYCDERGVSIVVILPLRYCCVESLTCTFTKPRKIQVAIKRTRGEYVVCLHPLSLTRGWQKRVKKQIWMMQKLIDKIVLCKSCHNSSVMIPQAHHGKYPCNDVIILRCTKNKMHWSPMRDADLMHEVTQYIE